MMNSMFLMTACLALVSVVVAVPFEPMMMAEASPMAQPDPMTTMTTKSEMPMLYLVSAGSAPYAMSEEKLKSYAESYVCPEKYGRAGFSVRCDVGSAMVEGPVVFRVDGEDVRRERSAPYFVRGDKGGKIFRYKGLDNETDARIVCKVKGYKAVWVDLKRKC